MFLVLAWIFISFQTILCDAYITKTSTTITGFPEYVVKKKVATVNDTARGPNRKAHENIFNSSVTIVTHAKEKPKDLSEKITPTESKNMTNRYPKYVNKERVHKLRKFLDSYKGLVEEFISSTNAENRTEPTPPMNRRAGRAGRAGRRAGRAGHRSGPPGAPGKPLPAQQLDMAPAAAAADYKRSKTKLNPSCYRHVMIPEGPKYDSRGNVYLKEYVPVYGKDFPQTQQPRKVLPRCCNCCQKSVLGCE